MVTTLKSHKRRCEHLHICIELLLSFTIESLSCFSFFVSFFLSFWCYMSVQPMASPFSGFTHIVCRHLMTPLGWQEDTNRKRITNIGTPRGIRTHDLHVCMVEGSIYHRFCGHCGHLFEF